MHHSLRQGFNSASAHQTSEQDIPLGVCRNGRDVTRALVGCICFTGCAQALKRCELCLSSTHTTNQCILAADPDPELPARLKAVESAVVSLATHHQNAHRVYCPLSTEICRLYNDNRCRFPKCRYRHACLKCNGDHPASSCPKGPKLQVRCQLCYSQQSTVERQ